MLKIHEIDARIVKDLLKDGRKSFSEMAQEYGVTKNKVWKHFKEMEKRGIIKGATVQVNFASFGFEALATLLISVEAQRINQFMSYVGKIPEIRAYQQYNSVYNIRAVTTLRDINELDRVKEAIRRYLPTNGLRTYIWTDVRNIPENLTIFADRKSENMIIGEERKLFTGSTKPKIDGLDIKIVDELALSGREPFSEIGNRIGTSTDTVGKRYRKLKQNGVIKVSIQIDPNFLGYSSILDFNIAFASPAENTFGIVESLAKIPDIVIITKTSGEYDLQVTAMIKDVEHMFSIQDAIAGTAGVTRIETSARKIPKRWPTPRQYVSTF